MVVLAYLFQPWHQPIMVISYKIFFVKIYKTIVDIIKSFSTFVPYLGSGGQGVIEIIFFDEIFAKFLCCEDGDDGTTSLVCTAVLGFLHILWCGLLFYLTAKAMREASSIG